MTTSCLDKSTGCVLTARQQAFVGALLAGLTQTEAAQTIGVTTRTATRYMAEPLVRAALSQAQGDALAQVTRRMNAGANRALDTLHDVMSDSTMPPSVRVRAALGWLEQSFKARELLEIEQRLEALEEMANARR